MVAGVGDLTELHTKSKVVATLLPYAILQERNRKPEVLDAFLDAAKASEMSKFVWHRAEYLTRTLLHKATPRAIVLISPRIPWHWLTVGEGSIQLWLAAASVADYTEEVAQSVVDTLLRIASEDELLPHITVDVWSWLTKRPSLPSVCPGRFYGSYLHVVKAVRELGDIEILKSYLLIVWSEWDQLWDNGFHEMCVSLCEDFGGVGMGHHRADLIQRLDQILQRLDRGFELPKWFDVDHMLSSREKMKDQYEKLRDVLLEVNLEAVSRTSCPLVFLPCIQTQAGVYRISRNIRVCATFAMTEAPLLGPSASLVLLPPFHP